ncbi:MAG TPA: class A beta-lactamase, subclass A2, partial [Ohtaekwangia sp.]|uniref:class A beta-lactamase, subclass A2 n=1 Tax=Ohtaekwangia sp. TaxID=2066019 RepID=UPI002F931ED4
LRSEIAEIARSLNAKVGVAVMHLEKKDTVSYQGAQHLVMQSVFKFPLAMAVLHEVDRGKLSLEQKIHITQKDMLPNTWSPMAVKYPQGNADVTLRDLLMYTVSLSDNNTCDMLFRLLGGPKSIDRYVHSLGVKNIAIAATEDEMHQAWDVQYTNWCEPTAMLEILNIFFQQKALSKSSTEELWKWMVESPTGLKRIKALLPANTIVAHKTGTGGTNDKGINGAINDAGIITLPNGQHVALVVFITDAADGDEKTEAAIARIGKAVYDHYSVSR